MFGGVGAQMDHTFMRTEISKAFLEDRDRWAELTLPSPSLPVLCLV